MSWLYGLFGLGAMGLAGLGAGLGYGLNNKRNLPEWYYSNPQPVILKYDGANLEHIRVAELKYVEINATSDTTAVFRAPTWNYTIEGDFCLDKATSTNSILRGNFSFATPPFLTVSDSTLTHTSNQSSNENTKVIAHSTNSDISDSVQVGNNVASSAGTMLSGATSNGVPQHRTQHRGERQSDGGTVTFESLKKREVPQSPLVISGHWMMSTHSPEDATKKEIFDAFYQNEMDALQGVSQKVKFGRTGEFVDFLAAWDGQCLEQKFPFCCSPSGLCV